MTTSRATPNLHAATQLFELWGGLNDSLMDYDPLIGHAKELQKSIEVDVWQLNTGVVRYDMRASNSARALFEEYRLFIAHAEQAKVQAAAAYRSETINRLREMIKPTPEPSYRSSDSWFKRTFDIF